MTSQLSRNPVAGSSPIAVYETPIGRIGMAICHDIRFPEPARLFALKGADIVAFPSNWPVVERVAPPSTIPEVLTRARAIGNRVHLAVADRAGMERGSRFLGRSQLVDVLGTVVAEAGTEETVPYADLDLALARKKDFVYSPGHLETHWFRDRCTDLYGPLVESELWPQTPRRAREAADRTQLRQSREGEPWTSHPCPATSSAPAPTAPRTRSAAST